METVRFAVVGCGNIGSRHLALLQRQPGATTVAICDIEEHKCRKFSALYGDVPAFTEYAEMLQQTDADVITICTPHSLHAPMAIEAAGRGKHVLVEKPMALKASDCEAMIQAAREQGTRLWVVKQNRYNVPILLTKRALDNGRLGRIFMVECNVIWNRHDAYYRESPWRGKRALEGGALYTQVSHFIDILVWWFGDIVHAASTTATKNHAIEIEDCGLAQVRFDSGVLGALLWTTCAYKANYEGSITLVGEKGTIKIGGQYLNRIEHWDVESCPFPDDVEFVDKPNSYGKYQGTSSNHDKVIRDVVSDLTHDQFTAVDGGEGLRTVRAIEVIYGCASS